MDIDFIKVIGEEVKMLEQDLYDLQISINMNGNIQTRIMDSIASV